MMLWGVKKVLFNSRMSFLRNNTPYYSGRSVNQQNYGDEVQI